MFYPAKYMADTPHFTTEQHGAYLLLLINYWQRGKALDNSNERLSHVVKLPPDKWLLVKDSLAEYFEVDGDSWTHGRMEFDLQMVQAKSIMASYAGRLGGKATAKQTLNDVEADAKRSLDDVQAINKERNKRINKKKKEEKDISLSEISLFDKFWEVYPRQTAKGSARESFGKALKKATFEEILAGATRLANDPNLDVAFAPHPSTWLNQERWGDGALPPRFSIAPTKADVNQAKGRSLGDQLRLEESQQLKEITSERF